MVMLPEGINNNSAATTSSSSSVGGASRALEVQVFYGKNKDSTEEYRPQEENRPHKLQIVVGETKIADPSKLLRGWVGNPNGSPDRKLSKWKG